MVEDGISGEEPGARGHDVTSQLRWGVVQYDEVDGSSDRGLEKSDQPESGLEAVRPARILTPIEQDAHVDIALPMGAAVGDAAKQVGRDDAPGFGERGCQRDGQIINGDHQG